MNPATFTEAFVARLAPVFHEVTLGAIRHLKFEEYPANAMLAGVGGLFALAIYYVVGVWLRRMPERVSTEEQRAKIEGMRKGARFWLPYLLAFAPTPIGGVIVMAAGFFRLNWKHVAVIVVAAETLFRAMPCLR